MLQKQGLFKIIQWISSFSPTTPESLLCVEVKTSLRTPGDFNHPARLFDGSVVTTCVTETTIVRADLFNIFADTTYE